MVFCKSASLVNDDFVANVSLPKNIYKKPDYIDVFSDSQHIYQPPANAAGIFWA